MGVNAPIILILSYIYNKTNLLKKIELTFSKPVSINVQTVHEIVVLSKLSSCSDFDTVSKWSRVSEKRHRFESHPVKSEMAVSVFTVCKDDGSVNNAFF